MQRVCVVFCPVLV